MFHESFGPRGAEEERDGFWTDLGEVTDAAYSHDPASTHETKRTLGLNAAKRATAYVPGTVQNMPPDLEEMPEEDIASRQDPLGSWTGVPSENQYEIPTQDADDL